MIHNSNKYGLVLAEGSTDVTVLEKIAPPKTINKLQYEAYEGKDKLKLYLKTQNSKNRFFPNGPIKKVLITRDADENWEFSWQSACEAVQSIFGVKVSEPGKWQKIENGPSITIWLAPGNKKEGMIETLCMDAAKISNPQAFECLETYVECLKTKDSIELHEKERFDIWTIVAQGKGPAKGRKRLPFTDVMIRLSLNWNSNVFGEIKTLIVQTAEF